MIKYLLPFGNFSRQNVYSRTSCFLILSAILFTGCTSVQVGNPNPRIDTPELPPAKTLSYDANATSSHNYEGTTNAGERPPSYSNRRLERSIGVYTGMGWSPVERTQVAFEFDPINANVSLIFRYQLLGESLEKRQAGNFSALLQGRVGGSAWNKRGNQDRLWGPGGYPWKVQTSSQYAMAGLSLGYRFSEKVLGYAGAAFGSYSLKMEINQDQTDSDPGGVYKHNDSGYGQTYGGGLMFNFTKVFSLVTGGEYSFTDYSSTNEIYDLQYRVGVLFTH